MATRTPKEIAVEWGTDARTLRKFLRNTEAGGTGKVGQGNRHAIEAKSLKSLKRKFDAWIDAKAAKSTDEATTPELDEVDDAIETE